MRFFALLTIFASLTFYAFPSRAEGVEVASIVVVPMKKGDVAPYVGVLLTPEAVAKIVAEAKGCQDKVAVETSKARQEERALSDKTAADAKAAAERDAAVALARQESLQKALQDTTSRLAESERSRSNTTLYVVTGIASGVVATLLTVYVVGMEK